MVRQPTPYDRDDYHDPTAGIGGAPPARTALGLRLALAIFGQMCVGALSGFERYVASLHHLVETLDTSHVHFVGHVSDEELSRGDGGDDNVIVVSKEKIDIPLAALDGNENGRIENQAGQDRSSATRS